MEGKKPNPAIDLASPRSDREGRGGTGFEARCTTRGHAPSEESPGTQGCSARPTISRSMLRCCLMAAKAPTARSSSRRRRCRRCSTRGTHPPGSIAASAGTSRHRSAIRAAAASRPAASATPDSPVRRSGSTPRPRPLWIILTSRLHPRRKGNATPIRAEVATLASAAILDRPKDAKASETHLHPVECGIDVLIKASSNRSAASESGWSRTTPARPRKVSPRLTSSPMPPTSSSSSSSAPSTGSEGLVDKEIGDSKDEKTGLPIISLYGKSRKPSKENLGGIDVLVYDIQDVGVRFYTYISTLGLVIEAAKESGIPVVVLDRPNLIGGVEVSGLGPRRWLLKPSSPTTRSRFATG